MAHSYRLYGLELSPYSIKVRSYLRYKNIPHQWIIRSMDKMTEFNQYAKLPLVPLLVTPDDRGMQDSTPIIEALEREFPTPALQPDDTLLQFISVLLEEFADEWVNKPMFHYRWHREADQHSAAMRIAQDQLGPNADETTLSSARKMIMERMVSRLSLVGSSEQTAKLIEDSFAELIELLEAHLEGRPYLLGNRPSLADFGLYAQLYECYTDPTPGELLKTRAPKVCTWIEQMLNPGEQGDFEHWETLSATLEPILSRQVAGYFLPWSNANAEALAKGQNELQADLRGNRFTQAPQKYHAKSLQELKRKFSTCGQDESLRALLSRAGCLKWLES